MAPQVAPAFQFYVRDWLTDTRGMSLEVKGAHIDLLAYSWAKGPLPNDEPELARILGVALRVFRSLWRVLSRCWKLTKRGWINGRLERTRREQRQYRKIQAEKGRLSAAARANRGSNRGSTAVQPQGQPKSNPATATAPAPAVEQELDQDHRADARPVRAPERNDKVGLRLAHEALDKCPDDPKNELKDLCAKNGIVYDAELCGSWLNQAEHQRKFRAVAR